jgi:hypothetical protein
MGTRNTVTTAVVRGILRQSASESLEIPIIRNSRSLSAVMKQVTFEIVLVDVEIRFRGK